MSFDDSKLKHDLEDYYGTATACGGGIAAFADLMRVKSMPKDQLIREAKKNSFDMKKYEQEYNIEK